MGYCGNDQIQNTISVGLFLNKVIPFVVRRKKHYFDIVEKVYKYF